MRWDPTDALCDALATAASAGTYVAMGFLDKEYDTASTTVTGLLANFSVSIGITQNLGDIQKASVTLTIASYPFWYEKTNA
jgi:hypothetical protein